MKASELLQAAYDLIQQPGKHVKGSYASSAPPPLKGKADQKHNVHPSDSRAVCFCSMGALVHVQEKAKVDDEVAKLANIALCTAASVDCNGGVFWVNDSASPELLHKMWKGAIEHAKLKENEDVQASG